MEAVLIRPVQARDADAEQAFVRALSPSSRYFRFHIPLRELPSSMLQAMTDVDQQRHVAYVAYTEDGEIVGDARYVQMDGNAREAEFAVVVADAHQGRGIGRELTERLMERARSDGLIRLVGDVLWNNTPMSSMVRDLGGEMVMSIANSAVRQARLDL
jgi:acetyltransferase